MLARLSNAFSGTDTIDAEIPRPIDVSPRLQEIEGRVEKLKERLAELKREHVRSIELMREAATDRIRRQAEELLEDRPQEAHRAPPEVHRDILAVEAALEQLRVEANAATMDASAIIRERVDPKHAELVKNIGAKMVALYEEHVAYLTFAGEMNEKGIAWSALHPMHVVWLGDSTDKYSSPAMWLREAHRNGFISADMIPEGLRL